MIGRAVHRSHVAAPRRDMLRASFHASAASRRVRSRRAQAAFLVLLVAGQAGWLFMVAPLPVAVGLTVAGLFIVGVRAVAKARREREKYL